MANTPENPSSPPKEITPTPSITPSNTPLSKKGRTKMLARKTGEETVYSETEHVSFIPKATPETIAEVDTNLENRFVLVGSIAVIETTESGEVGGKNKKEKSKESKGVRSGVRGKDTSAMVVWEEKSVGVNESVQKIGRSRSGKTAEGLVQLGKNRDEPGSSVEETLADLLKKVTESYNPKNKGISKAKTSGNGRENKKRKAPPSVTVEIPPTQGRATRSQLKQNEAKLQKALEESRRKIVAKGKKKMDEPVEAIDIDEMDLVLRDEEDIEEVEVLTPKAKTSTKKSEWSGEKEDDSDTEKDKVAKFGKRTILKGRLLRDLKEKGMVLLLEKLELQGWKDMVL
uniref:Uncharacterized protein n=1 Tax=Nicotiana tabacum TaxID=4097 RepID=A0A1S3ZAH7_TOBAC|nr:PREDICTED: uncharacterized protein LOC107784725 [Nicotiana tabacum]